MSGEDEDRGEPPGLLQALGIWVMVRVHHSGACPSGTWQDGGQDWGSGMVDEQGRAG